MAGEQTKNLLPPQFEIERYAVTESFSLTEWAKSIAGRVWRLRARKLIETADSQGSYCTEKSVAEMLIEDADRLIVEPMAYLNHKLPGLGNFTEPDERLVRDLDIIDYMFIRHSSVADDDRSIPIDPMAPLDGMYWRWRDGAHSDQDEITLKTPYWRIKSATPDGDNLTSTDGHLHVSVNLHASEKRLVEDFISWIRKTKFALRIPEKKNHFTESDMRKWHRNRILAYFDLKYWCEATGAEISDYQMGVALFPDEVDAANPADKVRKSVRPAAAEAFTPTISAALVDQALETARVKAEHETEKTLPE
ncbi:TPA: hypothetical protein QDB24_002963 [Burkholderia vietnamiensis]|uniref:DUF6387 family protein n=1 Tax=Burkholderia vietnamiensis TaxID=60552 RepID=UPI001B8E5D39|nr:DUF6387 family protein [Burkholderia vietnamiensis]MBR7910335.1 hypothetical protein [Burkholderia vietnamiensis]HDR9274883.1 hypothetical protein [Burkholderia vietnamiensis]